MEIWRSSPRGLGEKQLRAVNESIREAVSAVRARDNDSTHGFLCECLRAACGKMIRLTLPQYDDGRATPAWFLITPGHVSHGEHVVREEATYWIVERGIGAEPKGA